MVWESWETPPELGDSRGDPGDSVSAPPAPHDPTHASTSRRDRAGGVGPPLRAARCSAGLELGRGETGQAGTGRPGRVRRDGRQLPRLGAAPRRRALVRRLLHTAVGAGPERQGDGAGPSVPQPPRGSGCSAGTPHRTAVGPGSAGQRGPPTGDPHRGADVIRRGPPSPRLTSNRGKPSGRGRVGWRER